MVGVEELVFGQDGAPAVAVEAVVVVHAVVFFRLRHHRLGLLLWLGGGGIGGRLGSTRSPADGFALAQEVQPAELGDDLEEAAVAAGEVLERPFVAVEEGVHVVVAAARGAHAEELAFAVVDGRGHGVEPLEHGRQPARLFGVGADLAAESEDLFDAGELRLEFGDASVTDVVQAKDEEGSEDGIVFAAARVGELHVERSDGFAFVEEFVGRRGSQQEGDFGGLAHLATDKGVVGKSGLAHRLVMLATTTKQRPLRRPVRCLLFLLLFAKTNIAR